MGVAVDFSAQQSTPLPLELSPVAATSCPVLATLLQDNQAQVRSLLRDRVVPSLLSHPPCACGGPGDWTRIAHLDMSNPNQQCPPNWRLITTPVRGCGRTAARGNCESATFPSGSRRYSNVCGRVNAFMSGSPSAFEPGILHNRGVEGVYLEGISLTHGPPGSRQHIWSFATALFENDPNYARYTGHVCSCTNTNFAWPHQVPSFVGNNYFCDTANPGPHWASSVYSDDPLWDGEGCGPTNTCCAFNSPPWFCTTLPQPTTNDIELRICADQEPSDEDSLISLVDIYVM